MITKFKLSCLVIIVAVLYTLHQQYHKTSVPTMTSVYAPSVTSDAQFTPRTVAKADPAIEQEEGMGARVRRSIGTRSMRNFTPFLMLDHFNVSPEAGFPDHPHRGQETITYLVKGHIDHEDFTGSSGTLGPGDLQFMTAGRGVVHAEMPRIDKDEDGSISTVEGLQLWVDLPKELKQCEPRYRDLRAKEIPIAKPDDKITVKVISGTSYGVDSVRDLAYTPVWMLDVTAEPGAHFKQSIPAGFNSFLYIMKGSVHIAGKKYDQYTNVFFNLEGDGIELSIAEGSSTEPAQFILVAGQVLDQEIVQHGPFVETSKEKIMQAFKDYQGSINGFERAKGWGSKIGKRMLG